VLDVAQLLLASLDTSSVTLPEKGTAAREAEERAAKKPAEAPAKAQTATVEAEPEAEPKPQAAEATEAESKPVTGLGIAGGAKRPGAKKTAAAPAEPKAADAPAEAEAKAEAPAEAKAEVKGLGLAAGAKRPGAKKAPAKVAPNEGEATVTQPPNVDPDKAEPGAKTDTADSDLGVAKPEPEVKGLGIAAGARRPGAKKTPTEPAARPAAPQPEPEADGESAPAPEPSNEGNGETPATPAKGLGIAKGARPPGKR